MGRPKPAPVEMELDRDLVRVAGPGVSNELSLIAAIPPFAIAAVSALACALPSVANCGRLADLAGVTPSPPVFSLPVKCTVQVRPAFAAFAGVV